MTKERNNGIGLDREIPDEILRERTALVAVPERHIERGMKSIVIFRIGAEWLGLATNVFQEVAEQCTIHTVPNHRGGLLSGLVNVRGELLLCLALGTLLGIEPAPESTGIEAEKRRPHLLICNRKGNRFGFHVSEIFGTYLYDPEDLRAVPATLSNAAAGAWTVGILPWNGRTVGCLDDELVFYSLNKGLG